MGFEVLEIKGLPESIEMTNVALRRLGLGDSRDHFDLIDQNREHLRKFMPWEPRTRSLDELEGWIRAGLQKWEDGVCYDYAIFEKSTGRRVGGCGVHSIDWHHHHAELGYWIEAASQGKGWVGETVRALEDVLFGRGFHRI